MPRRIALACLGLLLMAGTAQAQVGFGRSSIPSRQALARVNLHMQWQGNVPLEGAEKLTELSVDSGMLFAQTTFANFHAFDAESGRYLWTAHLGRVTTKAEPAAVNAFAVYVTNSNQLYAFDRRTGRPMWSQGLHDTPSSAVNADEALVTVGLDSGKLVTFNAKTGEEKWNIQANARISSRPLVASRVIAFASEDKKLYLSRAENPRLLWRFPSGAPILAPLASHGVRTLIMASTDKNVYAMDLFTGETNWVFPTGAAVKQEPLVVDDDVYVVNDEGNLSEVDANTGTFRWTVSTLGGRLLAVSGSRVYLESHDDDLFVVDRQTGKIIFDPLTTLQRSGINLRSYTLGPTNRLDDRLYFGSTNGLLLCLREINQQAPRMLRDPKAKPFGFIPDEGYPDALGKPDHGAGPDRARRGSEVSVRRFAARTR